MSLDTDEMVTVADVFQGAYAHVLGNSVGEVRKTFLTFSTNIVMKEKPYLLVTEAGLKRIVEHVFEDDTHRDFILTLTYTFFSRWGHNSETLKELAENLARGATHDGDDEELVALPSDLGARLTTFKDAKELLEQNKWLMTVMLMCLFLVIAPQKE